MVDENGGFDTLKKIELDDNGKLEAETFPIARVVADIKTLKAVIIWNGQPMVNIYLSTDGFNGVVLHCDWLFKRHVGAVDDGKELSG